MQQSQRRQWLQRLAFSFIVIALVLIWEMYKSLTGRGVPLSQGRLVLYLIAAAISIAMGVAGIRSRHRPGE